MSRRLFASPSVVLALLALALGCVPVARAQVPGLDRSAPMMDAAADTDGAWVEMPPPCQAGHVAVFDSLRNRLITYDGRASGDVWVLQLGTNGGWSLQRPAGTPPPKYDNIAAAYDPPGNRMLVIGGGHVWALDLGGELAWSEVVAAGNAPGNGHLIVVFDPVRDRAIVYAQSSLKTWVLDLRDGPVWETLPAAGYPPLGEAAIYDPVRDRIVLFARALGDNTCAVWTLSLGVDPAWTRITPAGQAWGVQRPVAIYDPEGDRMILMGGAFPEYFMTGDVMALSLGGTPEWSCALPGDYPLSRWCHAGVYDSRERRLIVQGGDRDFADSKQLGDTWAVNLTGTPAWTPLTVAPPAPRVDHAVAWDSKRHRMMVYGGYSSTWGAGSSDLGDVGAYQGAEWAPFDVAGTPPDPRARASMVYDPVRDRLVVFGGSGPLGDLWALDLSDVPRWTPLAPTGAAPTARAGHSAIYDPVQDRMIVFGGQTAEGFSDEVWSLDLAGGAWTQVVPAGAAPAGRALHVAIHDPVRERMIVVGGTSGSGWMNDAWALTLSGPPAWVELHPSGTVPALRLPRGDYDAGHDQLVIQDADHIPHALSLGSAPAWRDLLLSGTNPGLGMESLCYDPSRKLLLTFGGGGAYGNYFESVYGIQLGAPAAGVPEVTARGPGIGFPTPNPAAGLTRLAFRLSAPGSFEVRVFDLAGREIRAWRGAWSAVGDHEVVWDGRDQRGGPVSPGVYLARIAAGSDRAVRRIVRIR
jgi:hypothetical protein